MKSRKIIFTTVLSALVCFGLCQQVQSATDTPDPGPLSVSNTADGQLALPGATGTFNSAFGIYALLSNGAANFNTGVGAGANFSNTADSNTATGAGALFSNSTATGNTANGAFALFSNTIGPENVAVGFSALVNNVDAGFSVAVGFQALQTATGGQNTAVGDNALNGLTTGALNTAIGDLAGVNYIGGETENICIGAFTAGVAGDTLVTRIGAGVSGSAVLAPGTPSVFIDGILENVVVPFIGQSIVAIDAVTGQLYATTDAAANKVAEQEKKIEEQQASISQLKSEMQTMVVQFKEQAAQIQKVSAQLEVSKPAPQVVVNKP